MFILGEGLNSFLQADFKRWKMWFFFVKVSRYLSLELDDRNHRVKKTSSYIFLTLCRNVRELCRVTSYPNRVKGSSLFLYDSFYWNNYHCSLRYEFAILSIKCPAVVNSLGAKKIDKIRKGNTLTCSPHPVQFPCDNRPRCTNQVSVY